MLISVQIVVGLVGALGVARRTTRRLCAGRILIARSDGSKFLPHLVSVVLFI